jgi:hypothetical protein
VAVLIIGCHDSQSRLKISSTPEFAEMDRRGSMFFLSHLNNAEGAESVHSIIAVAFSKFSMAVVEGKYPQTNDLGKSYII